MRASSSATRMRFFTSERTIPEAARARRVAGGGAAPPRRRRKKTRALVGFLAYPGAPVGQEPPGDERQGRPEERRREERQEEAGPPPERPCLGAVARRDEDRQAQAEP